MTDDLQWRRPPDGEGPEHSGAEHSTPAPTGPVYLGPPRGTPPPPEWRPRVVIQAPPPRTLPAQNLDEIEAHEREARTVTYGVGMIAAAVLLIVLFILCGRVIF
jgi:hypothetical protein